MDIVIIEDDLSIRENLQEILESHDFKIRAYADGLQGVKDIQLKQPDLILCDIMLPQIDGYEILQLLKAEERTASIPFIFLTAKVERTDQRKGMEMGADDYLTKPFTRQELINTINTRLKKGQYAEHKIQSAVNDKLQSFAKINSHEYNTPLNGIIGLSGSLIDSLDHLSKEEIAETAKAIHSSSKRLYRTFKNFLLYIQIQRGELNTPKTKIDAQWIHSYMESTLEEKALKFNRVDDAHLEISSETDFTFQIAGADLSYVMEELIWNAFKFSESGTPVKVILESHLDGFNLHISNTTPDPHFFEGVEPFKQIDREHKEQQGSGLGLYISKKIAEIYGWKLSKTYNNNTLTISLAVKA